RRLPPVAGPLAPCRSPSFDPSAGVTPAQLGCFEAMRTAPSLAGRRAQGTLERVLIGAGEPGCAGPADRSFLSEDYGSPCASAYAARAAGWAWWNSHRTQRLATAATATLAGLPRPTSAAFSARQRG